MSNKNLKSKKGKATVAASENNSSGKTELFYLLGIGFLAFLLYANSIQNDYALDDFGLISQNALTKQGLSAVPEIMKHGYRYDGFKEDFQQYRPLSRVFFAWQWSVAPAKPQFAHFINVLFFSFCAMLSYRLMRKLFPDKRNLALLTTLLFVFHPIHTEVVANIKSLDELLGYFFGISAILFGIQFTEKRGWLSYSLAVICFAMTLLAKESGVAWFALIPLALLVIGKGNEKAIIGLQLGLTSVLIPYLFKLYTFAFLHPLPLIEIDNYLVGISDWLTQKTTAIYLLGVYLLKLVYPHPLYSNGSVGMFDVVGVLDWRFILSAVLHTAALVWALISWNKNRIISFAILFYFFSIAVASNVFYLIGTNYAERLLFVPSFGFGILVAWFFLKVLEVPLFKKENRYGTVIKFSFVALLFFFAVKTVARNADWYNNTTLTVADLKENSTAARAHFFYANNLCQTDSLNAIQDSALLNARINDCIQHFQKAVEIFPAYAEAHFSMAELYAKQKDTLNAFKHYGLTMKYDSLKPKYLNNYGNVLYLSGKPLLAKGYFRAAVNLDSTYAHALHNLGCSYLAVGESYLLEYKKYQELKSDSAMKVSLLKAFQQIDSATIYLHKTLQYDDNIPLTYRMLSIAYMHFEDPEKSNYYDNLYRQKIGFSLAPARQR